MDRTLTEGPVMKSMLRFALPMILGNLLQQCYNVADTLIVGRFLGPDALAAVGSAFTLMTFLTSILLGLCMGSGTAFSIRFGQRDEKGLQEGMCASFVLIAAITALLNLLVFLGLDWLLLFLQVPAKVTGLMREYLLVIFCGIAATFLYNYFACLLRAVGESVPPLIFLAVSATLNIGLDLWFVLGLQRGVARGGRGHGHLPIRFGNRLGTLHLVPPAGTADKTLSSAAFPYQRNCRFFPFDLRAAVGDEPRHPPGAGVG